MHRCVGAPHQDAISPLSVQPPSPPVTALTRNRMLCVTTMHWGYIASHRTRGQPGRRSSIRQTVLRGGPVE